MKRKHTWRLVAGLSVSAVAVVGLALLALIVWLPSDAALAVRLRDEARQRLGVEVSIASAHWSLLPAPYVEVNDVSTAQEQPIVIKRLVARLSVGALLHRKFALDRLEIADAVFPRESLRAFRGKSAAGNGGEAAQAVETTEASARPPLGHLALRNVTWIPYSRIAVAYDGDVDFDANWRPRTAVLRRPASDPPFTLTMTREGGEDRWRTEIVVGGGTANGVVELKTAADGALQLSGQLAPRDIDIVTGMGTFERRSPLGGKASGTTILSARGESVSELARSLHTRSELSVASARILRFDLDKAMSTLGKEHAGETALEELTAQLETQNTEEGMRVTYSRIKARHDKYTARGEATIYHKHVEASGTLDVVDGAVGVPFTLSGPTQKPHFSVPPSFFAGAVVGTAIVPVIGTVIGARVGTAIGRLFKGSPKKE